MINITLLIFCFLVFLYFMSILKTRNSLRAYAFMFFFILIIVSLFINDHYTKPLEYE